MLNFELKRTGYRKHCVLTGPMGSIVRIEFSNPRDAALFAQRQADGYKATLWIVNERGGAEGCRNIPPLEGVEPRNEPPDYLWPQAVNNPDLGHPNTPPK